MVSGVAGYGIDGDIFIGGHHPPDRSIDEHRHAAFSFVQAFPIGIDAFLKRFPEVVGVIRGDLQVARPEGFRVVCPLDKGAQRRIGHGVIHLHHAQAVVVSYWRAIIPDEVLCPCGVLCKRDPGRPHLLRRPAEGNEDLVFYVLQVPGMDARAKLRATPKTDYIGPLVRMRARDKGVRDAPGRRYPLLHVQDIVGPEADQVQCHPRDARSAVVEDYGACPQVVVDTHGRSFVLKTRYPNRIEAAVPVPVLVRIAVLRTIHRVLVFVGPGVGYLRRDGHRCEPRRQLAFRGALDI